MSLRLAERPTGDQIDRGAIMRATLPGVERHRYRLDRRWPKGAPPDGLRLLTFVMLNPSIADWSVDDRTIGRCIGFSWAWGYDGLIVINLFALIATDPAELLTAVDPVGPCNDLYIRRVLELAAQHDEPVVAAWGANRHPLLEQRVDLIRRLAGDRLHCLGTTKSGAPRHPLYLPGDTTLRPWRAAA